MYKRKHDDEKNTPLKTEKNTEFVYPDWRFALVSMPYDLRHRPQFLHYFAYRKEENATLAYNLVTPDLCVNKKMGFKNDSFYNKIYSEVYSDANIQKIFKLLEAQTPLNQEFLEKMFKYENTAFVLIFECQNKKIYKQKIVVYKNIKK